MLFRSREYEKAPEVTRERLYLETMEQVLGENSKVLLDVKEGNSLMYLPLDQIIKKGAGGASTQSGAGTVAPRMTQEPSSRPEREVVRERRTRR